MTFQVNFNDILTIFSIVLAVIGALITLVLSFNIYAKESYKSNSKLRELVAESNNNYNGQLSELTFTNHHYFLKRVMDIILSIFSLLVLLPMIIIIIISLVSTNNSGEILTKIKRVGQNNKSFYSYKFKTKIMSGNEIKFTKVGRFLYETSLDALPLFINVLKGDMSIVGISRGYSPGFEKISESERMLINQHKPGILSLWAISSSKNMLDTDKRLEFDMYYVGNYSLMLDIKIISKAVFLIISKTGDY